MEQNLARYITRTSFANGLEEAVKAIESGLLDGISVRETMAMISELAKDLKAKESPSGLF